MLNEDKKFVSQFIKCELQTHMFQCVEYTKQEMIRKVSEYCSRLGVPSNITVESIDANHIIMKIDDGKKSFLVSILDFGDTKPDKIQDKLKSIIK